MTDPKKRAGETKRRRTRERLIEAALTVYDRTPDGEQFTLEDVAAEAGVGTATIYNHFSGFKGLVGSAVSRRAVSERQTPQERVFLAAELVAQEADPAFIEMLAEVCGAEADELGHEALAGLLGAGMLSIVLRDMDERLSRLKADVAGNLDEPLRA